MKPQLWYGEGGSDRTLALHCPVLWGEGRRRAGRGCLTKLETALLCYWPLLCLPMGPPSLLLCQHPTPHSSQGLGTGLRAPISQKAGPFPSFRPETPLTNLMSLQELVTARPITCFSLSSVWFHVGWPLFTHVQGPGAVPNVQQVLSK